MERIGADQNRSEYIVKYLKRSEQLELTDRDILELIRLDWIGLDHNGLKWIGIYGLEWNRIRMEGNGWEWIKTDVNGSKWM